MNKRALPQIFAVVLLSALVITAVCVVSFDVSFLGASSLAISPLRTPEFVVLSPENKTYEMNEVQLSLAANDSSSLITYTLDEGWNVTFSGNATLKNLPSGVHRLIVYAWNEESSLGNSKSITFKIAMSNSTPLVYASFGPVGGFTIRSPSNFTTTPHTVILNVTGQVGVGRNLALTMTYSLDGHERIPFPFMLRQAHDWNPFVGIITGSVTFSDLSEGSHSLAVYGNLAFNSSPNLAQAIVYFDVRNT